MLDLIFTSQPNLVVKFVVDSSLHQSFHHQIVHAKYYYPKNFYPPPYEHKVWHHKKANTLFADQSMSFHEIVDFLIQTRIKEYIHLIKPLNMFSLTFCRMRLSYMMIEIPIVSIVK